MKKYLILTVLLSQLALAQNTTTAAGGAKTTTIYLIRHAEKADASKNPELSAAGLARANRWNEILSAVKLDAVYSTDYSRTRQTAKPTAEAQKIAVTTYEPKGLTADKIKSAHQGRHILVVGHSNTIPELVNQLIGQNVYPMMAETEFGNLYIVTLNNDSVSHQLLKSL